MYTGQFIYCGKKGQTSIAVRNSSARLLEILASLTIGNVMPLGQMPEGTIVCQIEQSTGDRGKLAKASGKCSWTMMKSNFSFSVVSTADFDDVWNVSEFPTLSSLFSLGNYATIVSHNPDGGKTKVKLPSGAKKTLPSTNRAMVGKYPSKREKRWSKRPCILCSMMNDIFHCDVTMIDTPIYLEAFTEGIDTGESHLTKKSISIVSFHSLPRPCRRRWSYWQTDLEGRPLLP